MDQEKIGIFIAKCRKNKNMTQLQLAKELKISDRAVSKWERGKSLPDLSLLIPLCEILDLELEELLTGEKKVKKNIKNEHKILQYFVFLRRQDRRRLILMFIIVLVVLLFVVFLLSYEENRNFCNVYLINTTEENKNYCNKARKEYLKLDDRTIYTFCLNSVKVNDDNNFIDLKKYILKDKENIEKLYSLLDKRGSFFDGGTVIYRDGGSVKSTILDNSISNNGITIIKCNTIDGNKDIYIGPSWMEYESSFCK